MPDAILTASHLTKHFGAVTAVDDVSFTVARGEILGLLGANGAGKTTTLHLLLGLIEPSAGEVRVFDQSLTAHRREILQRVNFSSAYVTLPSNLTVGENLITFARLYGIRRARPHVESLLDTFGLPGVFNRITGSLSSGQQTRVNLIKGLINRPELLFLDEPTASLDPEIANRVRQTLLHFHREHGMTMIYTSHNMQEIERLCDRVIFMAHGRIVVEGSPTRIMEQARSRSMEEVFLHFAGGGIAAAESSTSPPDPR